MEVIKTIGGNREGDDDCSEIKARKKDVFCR